MGSTSPEVMFADIKMFVDSLFSFFVIIVMILAIFYAIYLGYRLARAEDDGKRKEAKQQLLWVLIGAVSAGVVFTLCVTIVNSQVRNMQMYGLYDDGSELVAVINSMLVILYSSLDLIAHLFTIGATVFAIYLISRFIKAADDGKRKEAKKQLLWTFIAILCVIMVIAILPMILSSVGVDADSLVPIGP
jgi:Na+-driven multidrug efflux pump